MRGLCVNTCTASQRSSAARSTAVEIPPAAETCAPKSTRGAYVVAYVGCWVVGMPLAERLGALRERPASRSRSTR